MRAPWVDYLVKIYREAKLKRKRAEYAWAVYEEYAVPLDSPEVSGVSKVAVASLLGEMRIRDFRTRRPS